MNETEMVCLDNMRIQKISVNEYEKVALLLTDAFETNPAYSLIFNRTDRLREGLLWLFRTSLFLLNRRQTLTSVVKEGGSDRIIGTFTLVPPGGVKNHFTDYMQIGLPSFLIKFGFRSLSNMLGMDAYNKEILNKSIKSERYYYLSMVAMDAGYRGKGLGSFAIKNCLTELSARKRDYDLLGLTTQLPENLAFYSKLGFEKIDEGLLDFKGNKYYNYNMKFNL